MSVILPWLPRNAIDEAAHALKMRETIADWSAKWLGHGDAVLAGMEAVAADPRMPGTASACEEGLVLILPDDALESIGRLMFGTPDGEPTNADLAAIAAAAERALADLRQRLAQIVGLPRDAVWRERVSADGAGHLFRIRLGQAAQPLAVMVADHLLIRGIKARLRPGSATVPLGAIAQGLAPHRITVAALLGTCRLSMAELAALGEGDVLVLDRSLDAAVPLVVDHRPQAASCRVTAGADHLDLTLV